jgi:hypothetical protein
MALTLSNIKERLDAEGDAWSIVTPAMSGWYWALDKSDRSDFPKAIRIHPNLTSISIGTEPSFSTAGDIPLWGPRIDIPTNNVPKLQIERDLGL